MHVLFRPITAADVEVMTSWRYPAPYDFYDWETEDDPADLLSHVAGCVVADDFNGHLAGFICFGVTGQVPGGQRARLYGEPMIDIGLGLRPDLTGRGIGLSFVQAGLAFGQAHHGSQPFRLTVAAFNERAIRVYERAGFVRDEIFLSPVHGVETPFLLMRRPNDCSAEPNDGLAT